MSKEKYGVIIQARMSSTRLPGKVLMDVEGQEMLFRQVDRLQHGLGGIPLVVATSHDKTDDCIESFCTEKGFSCFRGPLDDVMLRFILCAEEFDFDYIIRVGGDDPLIDPICCTTLVEMNECERHDLMYASNRKGWPYGCAAELISKEALKSIHNSTNDGYYREHTTPYFYDNPDRFKIMKVSSPLEINRPDYYFTVDFLNDIELVREVFKLLKSEGNYFSMKQLIDVIDENPYIRDINAHLHKGFDD